MTRATGAVGNGNFFLLNKYFLLSHELSLPWGCAFIRKTDNQLRGSLFLRVHASTPLKWEKREKSAGKFSLSSECFMINLNAINTTKKFRATEMPIKMRPWGKRSNIHAKFAEKRISWEIFRFFVIYFADGTNKVHFLFSFQQFWVFPFLSAMVGRVEIWCAFMSQALNNWKEKVPP